MHFLYQTKEATPDLHDDLLFLVFLFCFDTLFYMMYILVSGGDLRAFPAVHLQH